MWLNEPPKYLIFEDDPFYWDDLEGFDDPFFDWEYFYDEN